MTHRMGLFDGLMIKENHINAAGSLKEAVAKAHRVKGHMTKVEVEAETMDQAIAAYEAGADIVMLDNMSCDEMSATSDTLKGKVTLEASGGVSLQTVRAIAETGVDAISVGALTHSAPSLSIHLEFE